MCKSFVFATLWEISIIFEKESFINAKKVLSFIQSFINEKKVIKPLMVLPIGESVKKGKLLWQKFF